MKELDYWKNCIVFVDRLDFAPGISSRFVDNALIDH